MIREVTAVIIRAALQAALAATAVAIITIMVLALVPAPAPDLDLEEVAATTRVLRPVLAPEDTDITLVTVLPVPALARELVRAPARTDPALIMTGLLRHLLRNPPNKVLMYFCWSRSTVLVLTKKKANVFFGEFVRANNRIVFQVSVAVLVLVQVVICRVVRVFIVEIGGCIGFFQLVDPFRVHVDGGCELYESDWSASPTSDRHFKFGFAYRTFNFSSLVHFVSVDEAESIQYKVHLQHLG